MWQSGVGDWVWFLPSTKEVTESGYCVELGIAGGVVHACVHQKVMPINLIVRQNQPLKVKKIRTKQKERTELEREMSLSRKCEMFSLLMN